MRRPWNITKRTVVAFYDDQMTQHAAAITYYSLMSLFPAILLGLSVLGLVGEYPRTYEAIVRYLNDVAPASVVQPIDDSLRDAFRNKSTATTGLFLSIFLAFFGTTGVLESIRRALNVVFEVENGRSFLRRKAVDVVSTFALLALVLSTLVFVVVGKGLAEDILRLVGADENAAQVWGILRWPAAVTSALLGFAYVYYVTPDMKHKGFHLVTPGAVLGVVAWLLVSYGLSEYISNVVNIGALYGAFTGAIVVVVWLWLSSCSLLLGAELNAAIAHQRTMEDSTAECLADRAASPDPVVERSARRTRRRERRRARRDESRRVTAARVAEARAAEAIRADETVQAAEAQRDAEERRDAEAHGDTRAAPADDADAPRSAAPDAGAARTPTNGRVDHEAPTEVVPAAAEDEDCEPGEIRAARPVPVPPAGAAGPRPRRGSPDA